MYTQRSYQTEGGKLYLVPTPIGNLEDLTFRAINVLQEVDVILAEDTRHTKKLLRHFDIHTPIASHHAHSHPSEINRWIEQLQEGQSLALVSDAGMPLINDPGDTLVARAIALQVDVVPLPGANAALTALIASGLMRERFTYYGFVPRKKSEWTELLKLVGNREETAIFYESPFRIKETVETMIESLGTDVEVVIARELTKMYEQFIRGTAQDVLSYLTQQPIKGEIVLLIQGGTRPAEEVMDWSRLSLKEHVEVIMKAQNLSSKEAIKQVAQERDIRKQEVYSAYHEIER